MRLLKYTTFIVAATFALPFGLFAASHPSYPSTSWSADSPSHESARLLSEVRDHAGKAELESDGTDKLCRFGEISRESLGERLTTVRENVNDMGQELARLEDLRSDMPAAEQQEVDRIAPVLRELANHTEEAIQQLNQNAPNFWSTNLPDDLGNIYREAKQVNGSVAQFERNRKYQPS